MLSDIWGDEIFVFSMFTPIAAAIITIVARNPIHAILWLIVTFLRTCGLVFYHFSLGFTCSLIIIVYIGAIAIIFRFIIMMIPVTQRNDWDGFDASRLVKGGMFMIFYINGCALFMSDFTKREVTNLAEIWTGLENQQDVQALYFNGLYGDQTTIVDLYSSDIMLYGARLYQEASYPIRITGIVLLFVLVGAIVLCREE